MTELPPVDVLSLFKCKLNVVDKIDHETGRVTKMWIPAAYPELQIYGSTPDSTILTGWWRSKGKTEGQYPENYLKMINYLFGKEKNTIEVCSRHVQVDDKDTAATVDINPKFRPTYCTNAETLTGVPSQFYDRARGDPPYTKDWAEDEYQTGLPDFAMMLKAMTRVTKIGGLIFMLMGQGCVNPNMGEKPLHSGNLQECKPYGLKRIGIICISVVPNKEFRFLNIYVKLAHPEILERDELANQSTLQF